MEPLLAKLRSLPIDAVVQAAGSRKVYVVGGPVRDSLLGRDYRDIDFAVEGSAWETAEKFASIAGGRFVPLDEKLDESRVVIGDHTYDFSGFEKGGILADLGRRDFTVNSMAVDLERLLAGQWSLEDPAGGLRDLGNKLLRMTSPGSFREDPLRILRAFRLSAELGFEIERATLVQAREQRELLLRVAAERILSELLLIFSQPASFAAVRLMAETSVLSTVFPQLEKTRGVAQNKLHPLDVYGHSLRTYFEMEKMLEDLDATPFSGHRALVDEYAGSTPRRAALLKMAALLHDIAKPETIQPGVDDRLHFYGHDRMGGEQVEEFALASLRMSRRDARVLHLLVKNHMWPHLLSGQAEITDRAMRKFFRELEDNGIGVLMLAWADSLASVGPEVSSEPLAHSIEGLLTFYSDRSEEVFLPPLITGTDLIEILGLEPGPLFGRILREVEKEREQGRISSREDALVLARTMAERET